MGTQPEVTQPEVTQPEVEEQAGPGLPPPQSAPVTLSQFGSMSRVFSPHDHRITLIIPMSPMQPEELM